MLHGSTHWNVEYGVLMAVWLEMEGKESTGKNPSLWVIAFQISITIKKYLFGLDLVCKLFYMVVSFCSRTWRCLLNTLFQNSPKCLLSRKLPGSCYEGPVVYWSKHFNQHPPCSVDHAISLVMLHPQSFMVMIFC